MQAIDPSGRESTGSRSGEVALGFTEIERAEEHWPHESAVLSRLFWGKFPLQSVKSGLQMS